MASDLSVLIPHYNNLMGLYKTLESIDETESVDIIIVDDGSREEEKPNETELKKMFSKVGNIILLELNPNKGIEYALNYGLSYIKDKKYEYIARVDCGDCCIKGRFEKQKNFLLKNRDISLLGTWTQFVDMNGNPLYKMCHPTEHNKIVKKMFINSPFVHPSIMFRKNVLEKVPAYPMNFKYAEDYAFYFKVIRYFKVANLPEVLLIYEVNPKGISISKRKKQIKSRILILLDNWKWSLVSLYGLIRNLLIYALPSQLVDILKSKYQKAC